MDGPGDRAIFENSGNSDTTVNTDIKSDVKVCDYKWL